MSDDLLSSSAHNEPPLIIFCGMQSVGKTFFAKQLADHFSIPFYDVDDELVEHYGPYFASEKMTVRKLYKLLGKEQFRKKEAEVVSALLEKKCACLALGGGSITCPQVRDVLSLKKQAKKVYVIYLFAPKERLLSELEKKEVPAYLENTSDRQSAFFALFAERHALFVSFADLVVESNKNNVQLFSLLREKIAQQLSGQREVSCGK